MGGMQVLQWAATIRSACSRRCVAAAARHSAQNIAFHEVGRQAIMADPDWRGGDYVATASAAKGLAVARMAAHITYLSEAALQRKFGRGLQRDGLLGLRRRLPGGELPAPPGRAVRRPLRRQLLPLHHPRARLLRPRRRPRRRRCQGVRGAPTRFCVFSFTSDWLYPTPESRDIVRALNAAGARASFVEIETDKGHDAFLLDEPVLTTCAASSPRRRQGARPEHGVRCCRASITI